MSMNRQRYRRNLQAVLRQVEVELEVGGNLKQLSLILKVTDFYSQLFTMCAGLVAGSAHG